MDEGGGVEGGIFFFGRGCRGGFNFFFYFVRGGGGVEGGGAFFIVPTYQSSNEP
jgi:hypothetical protein